MTDIATLGIAVNSDQVPQAQRRLRDLEQTGGRTERTTDSLRNSFQRMAGPLRMLAGAAGFGGVALTMRNLVSNTAEQQRLNNELNRTFRNTGRDIPLEDIQAFSAEMQDLTTFSNEAVEQVVTMNARLGSLSDEGMMRATKAALDLAAATGTDATRAADRLARSLAQPERAATRLQRSGVFLTQQTEDLIDALVEQGRELEAQEVLLSEVERQMGGAAEAARDTLGGALTALKENINDLQKAEDGFPRLTEMVEVLNDTFFVMSETGADLADDRNMETWSENTANAIAFAVNAAKVGGSALSGIFNAVGQQAAGWGAATMTAVRGDFGGAWDILSMAGADAYASLEGIGDVEFLIPDQIHQRGAERRERRERRERGDEHGAPGGSDLWVDPSPFFDVEAAAEDAAEGQSAWNASMEEGRRLTESMRTPMEVYQDSIESIWQLFQMGAIDAETMARASEDAWQRMADASEESTEEMSQFAIQAQRNIQSALGDTLVQAFKGDFDNILDMWIDMLLRMAAEATAANIMDAAGGGGDSGFWAGFASIFGRASGGRVNAGQPYIGAEGGRGEMFIPDSSGEVVPNHKLGGAQLNPTWNIDARGANAEAMTLAMRELRESEARMKRWVADRESGRAV